MRPLCLLFSFFLVLTLTACGTEDELIPPVFSNVMVNGETDLSIPFNVLSVTITGSIDDVAATLVANSTVTGEVPVAIDSSAGSWSFVFGPLTEGANIITLTATDKRGNINQMYLTVLYAAPE